MATIYVTDGEGEEHRLAGDGGASLMEIIRRSALPVMATCGGNCSCATCHVYVEPAWTGRLAPAGPDELDLVSASEHYKENLSRLSCQIQVTSDLDGLRVTLSPDV